MYLCVSQVSMYYSTKGFSRRNIACSGSALRQQPSEPSGKSADSPRAPLGLGRGTERCPPPSIRRYRCKRALSPDTSFIQLRYASICVISRRLGSLVVLLTVWCDGLSVLSFTYLLTVFYCRLILTSYC